MKLFKECSREVRIERWENVVRVLENLTPHQRRRHWDMGNWTRRSDCGTIACAAGHCGMDAWFRRRGFKMGPKDLYNPWSEDLWSSPDDFFGLDGSAKIFYNDTRRSVTEVIEEVKAYVESLKDLNTMVWEDSD